MRAGEESDCGTGIAVDEAVFDDAVLDGYYFQAVEFRAGQPAVLDRDSAMFIRAGAPKYERTGIS